jgi:hypothetical protein
MQATLCEQVTPRRGLHTGRPALKAVPKPLLKSRYRIRTVDGVPELVCVEAPTIAVQIRAGVTASAQDARSAPAGTIFLDGAAQCAPFTDPARRIYNLDHHEGCVRSFTLSTCEQAMVLVRKGLELRSLEWTVRANDADLDAILAIWVLLNHLRLSDPNDPVRAEIMPLLRLEGAIDAQGLDLQDFCALPPALFEKTRRRMDRLREQERHLKSAKGWHRVDLLEYVRDRLAQIDSFVYPSSIFEGIVDVEEIGRTEMSDGSIALACRTRAGIYEVERELRRLHGPRLGLILLEQRSGVYTLRQVKPSLPAGLDQAYAHLNLVDAATGSTQSGNRWGGSGEIGGSPRRTGSKLSTSEVLEVCVHAFSPATRARHLAGLARAIATTAAVLLGSVALAGGAASLLGMSSHRAFGYALGAVAGLAFLIGTARARCVFGLRLPLGSDWLRAIPFAVAAALVAGSGLASRSVGEASPLLSLDAALPWMASLMGTELLFRGLVYGHLVWAFGPQAPSPAGSATSSEVVDRSSPVMLAALLSSAAGLILASPGAPLVALPESLAEMPLVLAGSLVLGIAAGFARQRSESVLAAIAVYAVAAAAGVLPAVLGLV